ncbi:hypothetical protein N2152v2_003260 [Parachlorella kessleri]
MEAKAGAGWNKNNAAVRRIVAELKELQRDSGNYDVLAEANDDNIFEWHFVVRGAWDTEFEGGIYHGRIIMPPEYPFKPPAFVMLTPSGRFETNVKICLSISSHHPESWQPSWSVRSALVALIAFMQSPGHGALGSLDQPKDVRRQLAAASRQKPPTYGNEARQALILEMHQRMLDLEPLSRQQYKPMPAAASPAAVPVQQQAEPPHDTDQQRGTGQEELPPAAEAAGGAQGKPAVPGASLVEQPSLGSKGEAGLRQRRQVDQAEPLQTGLAPVPVVPALAARPQPPQQHWAQAAAQLPAAPPASLEDRLLTWLALLLAGGILLLVARRVFGGVLLGTEGVGRAGHALSESQL